MTEHQHTMPIGCVPNQLQALHDEVGHLRALLKRSAELTDCENKVPHEGCRCEVCLFKKELKAKGLL